LNRDGSNTFGSSHLWATIWSVGAGWNISREAFAQDWDWLSELRIRGTYGTNANQGTRHITTNVFGYLPGSGLFGMAAWMNELGNPYLRWMIVENLSAGIDIGLLNPRINFTFNIFRRISDPQVVRLPQTASTGMRYFPMNFGFLETVGYDFRIGYTAFQRNRTSLTLTLTGGNNRSIYGGFGDLLEFLNNELLNHEDATIDNMLRRYQDGTSPDDMWAVPSLGIDPMTGREIFLRRDGTHTFEHNNADRVVVANSRPVIEGTMGAAVVYRQLRVNFAFRYRLGAYIFNTPLFNRVENISRERLRDNQDRRALYERWQQPGDIAQFRGISLTERTHMSSRFIQRESRLTGESVNILWDFERDGWIQKLGMQSLNAGVSMRDIFFLSNIRTERGIDFPFARAVTFNINATF
jgi:hypothetical protein